MTQRKLTDDELGNVMVARCTLRKIRKPLNKPQCFDLALIYLDCVALHATTDGKPYVEPEPPILDGYRLAVAGDKGRSDIEIWNADRKKWCVRANDAATGFSDWYHYIVPADRTPTDEDAKSRPEVMVRNRDDHKWQKYTLLAVFESRPEIKFLCLYGNGSTYAAWKQARHLYPGE